MNLQRVTRIQVALVGLVVVVAIALIFFLLFVRPQRRLIDRSIQNAMAAEQDAARRPSVEAAIEEAEATEKAVNEKYEEILDTRMPKLDFGDPIAATVRMWDLAGQEQQVMDRWFASTGARVSGYSFPGWGTNMPGSFPNPNARTLDPLNWNLTVEVKDFPALLEWLATIPKAPRFMVMQSVTIQGPRQPGQPLVAQVPVTLYQWTGVEPEAVGTSTTTTGGAAGATTRGPRGGGRGMGGPPGGRGGRGMGGPRGGRGGGPRGGRGF